MKHIVAARDMAGFAIDTVEELAAEALVGHNIVKFAIGPAAAVVEAVAGHQVEIYP